MRDRVLHLGVVYEFRDFRDFVIYYADAIENVGVIIEKRAQCFEREPCIQYDTLES